MSGNIAYLNVFCYLSLPIPAIERVRGGIFESSRSKRKAIPFHWHWRDWDVCPCLCLGQKKLPVSGSDQRTSHITERLAAVGAHIFSQQVKENLQAFGGESDAIEQHNGLPQVICSTAIGQENPEFQAAQSLGCHIFHRSDVLSALVAEYDSVAVGGTHGKTTTSSLIGYIFLVAGVDPTIIVGGEVDAWDGNARLGQGNYLVAEADESDGTLVKLRPQLGVVTNIELDHPDHYQSLDQVVEIFQTFAQQCDRLIACVDCPTIATGVVPYQVGYGLQNLEQADYWATDIHYGATSTQATIWERGDRLGEINLALLGAHNLSNALGAIAAARCCGVPFEPIAEALASFQGQNDGLKFAVNTRVLPSLMTMPTTLVKSK